MSLTTDDPEHRELCDAAINAFRSILINRPDLVWMRLEPARTFFLKGTESVHLDAIFGCLPFHREGGFGTQFGFGLLVWGGDEYQQRQLGSERLGLRVGAVTAVREYPGRGFASASCSCPATAGRAGPWGPLPA